MNSPYKVTVELTFEIWYQTNDSPKEEPATQRFKKRPNTYLWCHVDDVSCVAQGSSGSVALWVKD